MTEPNPSNVAAGTLLEQVLALRTRYLTVVTEDLYQSHNGAAVIRACEGFGIQNLHTISNKNSFKIQEDVVEGASNYVDVFRYDAEGQDNTTACLTQLKAQGYRIAATTLRTGCVPIEEVPLDQPLALCFGTEMRGLTDRAHELADLYVRLPMYGFTQSFNISVSTAISLFELTRRLWASVHPWPLSEAEKAELRRHWTARWGNPPGLPSDI